MHPSHQIAYVGDSVTISCAGDLNGTSWYKEGDKVPAYYLRGYDPDASDLTLLVYIKDVQLKDAGIYTCAGWLSMDNDIKEWIKDSTLVVGGISNFSKVIAVY